MWKEDLEEFLKILDETEHEEQLELEKMAKKAKADGKQKKARKKVERVRK